VREEREERRGRRGRRGRREGGEREEREEREGEIEERDIECNVSSARAYSSGSRQLIAASRVFL
jgi:hypothetical protein